MRFTLAALAALLPVSALATITITGPSPSSFWVQNTSNVITWTFNLGDPSPVDIIVVNSDDSILNGAFSIAGSVDVSAQSFTVTNVTLNNGSNYEVEFVNPNNQSQVFATSQSFSVMPNGTAPAPTASTPSSTSGTSSGSSSAPSGSSTAPSSTSSATISSGAAQTSSNAAPRSFSFGSSNVFPMIAAGGVAALTAVLL